ncbi:o-succinylbenzoate synthase [Demequina muriae]|uniref:o-succinylbenzoate synthase n=1 Tax=Demequina muriae TaxID=3051664 RepID=A0ABT8GHM0_9MICO|nr:o-succinylbenzoate synthase [Demequina sp. EGI L300058]MDN4480754.1 o-succinylbenzoate synthase [Demequina sp. EGI L300058]
MEFRPFTVELRTRFRGLTSRSGVLVRAIDAEGHEHWGEYSPFADYSPERKSRWWRAAMEAARGEWPAPVRDSVAVNSIVPEVDPERARAYATAGGARTAKVKVGGGTLADDIARIEAVADALGAGGAIRIDVNGGWELDDAVRAIQALDRAARTGGVDGLEYVEQPCDTVADLASLRRRVDVPIAADEAIRIPGTASAVLAADAADVFILKASPLGGVRRALEIADEIAPRPVVIASSMESSVGLAAGIALACALPEEPLACGLGTGMLLATDTVASTLAPTGGRIGSQPLEVI